MILIGVNLHVICQVLLQGDSILQAEHWIKMQSLNLWLLEYVVLEKSTIFQAFEIFYFCEICDNHNTVNTNI